MIEILYFEGCPNLAPTLELAREVVAELGLDAALSSRVSLGECGEPGGNQLDVVPEALGDHIEVDHLHQRVRCPRHLLRMLLGYQTSQTSLNWSTYI